MKSLLAILALALLPISAQAQTPRITAVSGPLADFAARLAGDAAEVVYPVPQGVDPMAWRPGIGEISAIQSSDLILLNGAGFAGWTAKTSLPRARTVNTSAGFEDRFIGLDMAITHAHGAEGAHSHTGTAPQVWMDFTLAGEQVAAISQAMTRLLPDRNADIATARAELDAELQTLGARATALGAELAGRVVISAYPGLEYFARAYGIDMVTLNWSPDTAPGEAELASLSAALADGAAPLMLYQTTPPAEAAEAAAAHGLAGIVVIDPGADAPGGFVDRMNANMDALQAALSAI